MTLIERVIKPQIRGLTRLADSAPDRFDYLRLDKNERLLEFAGAALRDLQARLISQAWTGYPELAPLYDRLAAYLGVAPPQLYLTSGSDLAIRAIYEAAVGPGDEVVLHLPSYAMYRVYTAMTGAVARSVPLRAETWQVDWDGMLAQVGPRTKLLAVEYPNGFLGTVPAAADLARAARCLCERNVLLVIDGAYYYVEHSANDLRQLVADWPNVLLVQTFSKAHGLAGARLGYVVGRAELVQEVAKTRPMHELTGPTAVATHWLLDHPELLTAYQQEVAASKQVLREGMARLGVDWRDTAANFVLLFLPDHGRTANLTARLKQRGILIRRPFTEPWLAGWCRVTVGTCADSRRLTAAITDALAGG